MAYKDGWEDVPQDDGWEDIADDPRAAFLAANPQDPTVNYPMAEHTKSAKDFLIEVAKEPVRLAQEAITVPVNAAINMGYNAFVRPMSDNPYDYESSRRNAEGYHISGPSGPSYTGKLVGKAIDTVSGGLQKIGVPKQLIDAGLDTAGLIGGTNVVRSAIGAVKPQVVAVKDFLIQPGMNKAAAKLTDMTLKQPTKLKKEIRTQNVETALEGGYTPTAKGVERLESDIATQNASIQDRVNTLGANERATLDTPAQYIEALREEARRSSDPVAAEAAIDAELTRLQNNPLVDVQGTIDVPTLQKMKIEQGRELSQKYQNRDGQAVDQFQTKIDKARVRGLKDTVEQSLAQTFPELAAENGQLSSLYKLQPVLDGAYNRISNNQGIGIGLPIKSGSGAAIGSFGGAEGAAIGAVIGTAIGVIEHPLVAPRLAQALYKSQKGKISMSDANRITLERLKGLSQNLPYTLAGEQE